MNRLVTGNLSHKVPILRISWESCISWIIFPLHIKSRALKVACVNKWKKDSKGKPAAKVITIIPSWLSVERATTFLRSHSCRALTLAIIVVRVAVKNKIHNILYSARTGLNRIKRYTPAVTSVEECTRALTGVGAAIAAGSQAEKGIWALLVTLAKIINTAGNLKEVIKLFSIENIKFQLPISTIKPIISKIATSPRRLVMAVIIPAALDLGFW